MTWREVAVRGWGGGGGPTGPLVGVIGGGPGGPTPPPAVPPGGAAPAVLLTVGWFLSRCPTSSHSLVSRLDYLFIYLFLFSPKQNFQEQS